MRNRLLMFATFLGVALMPFVSAALMLDRIALPPGFSLNVFAEGVANARQITVGGTGMYYVGSRSAGVVYAVVDKDGDYVADSVHTIADGLYMPSGVAYRKGTLYVAEVNRIIAFHNIDSTFESPGEPEVVFDRLPGDAHHGWKFIDFDREGRLYVPVGAPCNICEVDDPYGTIMRVDLDTQAVETVARGVRNSVGFDWHPDTGELWFSDNGRDWLGDDLPPGELNRVSDIGAHYGYPYRHGADVVDPDIVASSSDIEFVAPAMELPAHVAPLTPLFYRGVQFPNEYRGNILLAEHGSWNRSRKIGYRIMRINFDAAGQPDAYQPFATGWQIGEAHWGRPVDLELLDDGSILVTDDHAGAIYRIVYNAPDGSP